MRNGTPFLILTVDSFKPPPLGLAGILNQAKLGHTQEVGTAILAPRLSLFSQVIFGPVWEPALLSPRKPHLHEQ